MGDPARWEPIRGELYWAFPEEGPTERMPYPRGGRHELIEVEHEAGPVATVWPEDDEEEDVVPELDVVEDSEVWIAAWREFDEDTPTMRAVLAEHNAPADRAEEAA